MNQPYTPIAGYSSQSTDALGEVNRNKVGEEALLRMLDKMKDQAVKYDQRWLAVARTHFEQGFMAMNRAIMKPSRLTDEQIKAVQEMYP